MSKKVLAFLLSAIMCFGVLGGALSASAKAVESVHLDSTESSDSSGNVTGTYMYYWGNNSKDSKHSVYLIARYKSIVAWYEDSSKLMQAGYSLSESDAIKTKTRSSTKWFVRLNPEGAGNTGCTANGYIK